MTKKFILFALVLTVASTFLQAAPSVITTSGTLNAFTACSGTASTAQNFTVGGTNLTANLIVTSPTGFEVSLTPGSGYADSLSLVPIGNTVSNTAIYVRLDSSATGTPSGNITCTSTGATTKNVAASGTVTTIITSILSQTNISCFGGANGSAAITASGGTGSLSYSWSPSGGTSAAATGLAAGNYSCIITDANSCTKTQNVSITQPRAISSSVSSKTNVSCNGGSNGSATITASGGTGSLSYSWSPSGGTAATATGLAAGNYSCIITDANSCTKTQNVTITQPPAITTSVLSQNDASCYGGSNGAATITASGGTGALSYLWSPYGGTSTTAYGLTAGKFTCSVSDINSCVKTQDVSINQPPAITTSLSSQTNVPCYGGSNGVATVTASGGTGSLNYYWSPTGVTTPTDSGLTAGTYICYIGDANDCGTQVSVTITQGAAINTSILSQTNISCFGNATGAATISASGGTGTLTYLWLPTGGTANSATGLTGGSYTCRVTDQSNCVVAQAVTLTQPAAALNVTIDTTIYIKCYGETNGAIHATVTGGTQNYNYHWNNNRTTPNLTSVGAGIYQLNVTDNNGCTAQSSIDTLTQPTALVVLVDSVKPVTCDGGNDGAINITASGSVPAYTYSWPGGIHTQNISNLATGTYIVTVMDNNSCNATSTAHVGYLHELPAVTLNLPFETVCMNAGTQTLSGASPAGGTFSGTGVQGSSFSPSIAGTDTVIYTYTDNNGCTNKATASLVVSICEGIQEVANGSMSLYPNPTTSMVNLKTDGIRGKLTLQIYDNMGRLVRETNGPVLTGSDVTSINVEDLVAAHYFVRVTAGETQTTFNIIVQR